MNEVTTSNIPAMTAGSASAQTRNGSVRSQTEVPKDAGVSSSKPQVEQPKVEATPVFEEQQEQIEKAVSKLNDYVQSTQRDLQFSFDEEAGRPVVTVLDRETQQVVRRIPDEVVLNLAKSLNAEEPIQLFSAQA